PMIGNNLLVKGNIEGFSRLYPFVQSATCDEQFSQVSLASVIEEFGNTYVLTPGKASRGGIWSIKERGNGRLVAEARSCRPGTEPVTGWGEGHAFAPDIPGNAEAETSMLKIERGGILRAGSLEHVLREGDIY